jgi:pimeloyl-ACP methyl ester carboxylesterase
MERVLFLPGYACTSDIWKDVEINIDKKNYIIKYVDWPKDKLKNFTTIEEFSNWVEQKYVLKDSIVVGHSMGGLVAFDLAKRIKEIKQIILVESFLKTPTKFFQNLFLDDASIKIKNQITNMLEEESKYYNQSLSSKLKDLDLVSDIELIDASINCIYGAREEQCSNEVIEKLGINKENLSLLEIRTIPRSSHFPMIENFKDFNKVLLDLLGFNSFD